MHEFKVKDVNLSSRGELQVEWASTRMPVLNQIKERFKLEEPLKGTRIGASLHVTKETAVLVETLVAGGAIVSLCGSNPLSTQDDVAASLAEKDVKIYAWRGQTSDDYYWCVQRVIDQNPQVTIDDGADLVGTIHSKRREEYQTSKEEPKRPRLA